MKIIRRLSLAALLALSLSPAFGQVAPPVPALPDSERRTSYSISASTCACNVGFALYGDSTDIANWIEVFVNGVRMAQAGNWTLSSVTGTIGSIPLPITNAVLTFTAPQTGTIQIVGARRPRRTSQFNEGAGIPTRNMNVVISDLTAQNRELWDKTNDVTGRALMSQPGVALGLLPLPAACASGFLGFDATGLIPQCSAGGPGSGTVIGPLVSVVGNAAIFNNTTGSLLADAGSPPVLTSQLGTAVATFLATPSSANLRAALTDEVGTGAAYFVGGALGTPASGTATNLTGLPIGTGVSGLGTGVATALGVNIGSAGAPVVNGGALGTPASGVATNLTGTAAGLTAGNATLAATVTTNANLTGPVTSVGNATAIANNQITRAMEAQGVARSVIGVAGNATANVADIQGTANQFLGVNSAGTALAFNTLSQDCALATGVITCLKTNNVAFTATATAATGQLPGEPSNGSATAGNVGEYVESVIIVGSAVPVVTATGKTITSISLTAGDWDVDAVYYFLPAATTSFTVISGSLSLVTNTTDNTPGRFNQLALAANVNGGNAISLAVPPYRFSLSATTTIFLTTANVFSASTASAYGIIRARRAR